MTKSKSAEKPQSAQSRALDETRSKYLDNASRLLFASSPSTSAFVQHERQKLFQGDESLEDEEREHKTCPSCGTILITGITSRMLKQKSNTRRKADQKSPNEAEVVYIQCHRCNSKTRQTIEKQRLKRRPSSKAWIKKTTSQTNNILQSSSSGTEYSPSTWKGKGRKRPQKPSSLQELLARSKAQSSTTADPGFGLGLKDLFKED